jgi:2-C-methyl-D-erythritol 4-phosphate cytidylyltransferase
MAEELGAGKVVATVEGGPSRTESVRIGVAEVPDEADVIIVHDAARPLVGEGVIERLLRALPDGVDGAVPGLPVTDTVKRVAGSEVVQTLPREELVAVQTPQAFAASALRAALAGNLGGASDCASLVEAQGGRIRVVEGDPRLLKVTTPADLAQIEAWLAA